MTTAIIECEKPTVFDIVNQAVQDARANEVVTKAHRDIEYSDLFPSPGKLLEHLISQAPNRIYFGPDGRVLRVLFFSEEKFPFQARIETLNLQPQPEVIKSEVIVTGTIKALEQEIDWWRRRFGMDKDLLLKPTFVMESLTTGDFFHLGPVKRPMGRVSVTDFIYCCYHLSSLNGPRFYDSGIGIWPAMHEGERFRTLIRPPEVIARHANPFTDPQPK